MPGLGERRLGSRFTFESNLSSAGPLIIPSGPKIWDNIVLNPQDLVGSLLT